MAPGRSLSDARERDPRDCTPRHLADKILQSKSALEGERKQVTVLFADVKASTALADALDPEEWHRMPVAVLLAKGAVARITAVPSGTGVNPKLGRGGSGDFVIGRATPRPGEPKS